MNTWSPLIDLQFHASRTGQGFMQKNRLYLTEKEDAEHWADLTLHMGLLTEYELPRVLQMLDGIQGKMGLTKENDSELADLKRETRPEDVLGKINRLQQRALARAPVEKLVSIQKFLP